MRTSIFPASWNDQQLAAEVAGVVDENVTGVRVVKAFGQEQREVARLTDTARRLFASRVRSVQAPGALHAARSRRSRPSCRWRSSPSAAGWRSITGSSLGTFLAFSTYAIQLMAPVRMFATILAVAQQARAGAERILDILDSNPLVTETADASDLPPVARAASSSTTSASATCHDEPVLDGFTLADRTRARRWRSSAPRARASRRSRCCSHASTTSPAARSASTASTSATSRSHRCAARSGSCSRRRSSSPTRCGPTSPTRRPDATDAEVEAAARGRRGARVHHRPAGRLRHGRRRTGPHALRRPASAGRRWPGPCSPTRAS